MLVWTNLQICQYVDHVIKREIRSFALMLMPAMKSSAVMLWSVQGGNNNTYCHDSELNWFNWEQAGQDETGYARFFRCLVNLRSALLSHLHPLAWSRSSTELDTLVAAFSSASANVLSFFPA